MFSAKIKSKTLEMTKRQRSETRIKFGVKIFDKDATTILKGKKTK